MFPDPLRPHLGDDVEASLCDEGHRRGRGPVFEPAPRRVVLEVLDVEGERFGLPEPPGHQRFELMHQVVPHVQERQPGPSAQPLQNAGGVEVAPQVAQVHRDDPGPMEVVHE